MRWSRCGAAWPKPLRHRLLTLSLCSTEPTDGFGPVVERPLCPEEQVDIAAPAAAIDSGAEHLDAGAIAADAVGGQPDVLDLAAGQAHGALAGVAGARPWGSIDQGILPVPAASKKTRRSPE
jgi:hypothetical protein